MKEYTTKRIEIVDHGETMFFGGEEGHTPYTAELLFYEAIARGDEASLRAQIDGFLKVRGVRIGRMSDDPLRQSRYWAVSCITLAARAAIAKGMPEEEALSFSDEVIRTVDGLDSPENILDILIEKGLELCRKMELRRSRPSYPAPISAALRVINARYESNPTAKEIAERVGLSPDHLARLFRKTFGMGLKTYINEQRLARARILLLEGKSLADITYSLRFSSESHFVASFHNRFGLPPKQYLLARAATHGA